METVDELDDRRNGVDGRGNSITYTTAELSQLRTDVLAWCAAWDRLQARSASTAEFRPMGSGVDVLAAITKVAVAGPPQPPPAAPAQHAAQAPAFDVDRLADIAAQLITALTGGASPAHIVDRAAPPAAASSPTSQT